MVRIVHFVGKKQKVGILELAVSRAPHKRLSPTAIGQYYIGKQFVGIMPQTISVWARQMGHEVHYAHYYGQADPMRLLPDDLDIVFISAFTQASGLSYALAKLYRLKGVQTVLGGPHAKAFPQDALRFFDQVVKQCNKESVQSLIGGIFPKGTIVNAESPPHQFATVEERMPEIRKSVFSRGRRYISTSVPLLASTGCPYACNFCIDWDSPYQVIPDDQLEEDLRYVADHIPGASVGFADPNFAIRFNQTLDVLERIEPGKRPPYLMEASLTSLTPERLPRLRDTRCYFIAPGIESWGTDYSNKVGTKRVSGYDKVRQVVEQFRLLQEYVPGFQANFIFGLDADQGEEPVELIKEFMDQAPWVWPTLNIPQPFGGTPLFDRYLKDGRILEAMPLMFYYQPYLVTTLANYDPISFFRHFLNMIEHAATREMWRQRMKACRGLPIKAAMTFRTLGSSYRIAELKRIIEALETSRHMRDFHSRGGPILPDFYRSEVRRVLGPYASVLTHEDLNPVLD